jgi:hypothetical protein
VAAIVATTILNNNFAATATTTYITRSSTTFTSAIATGAPSTVDTASTALPKPKPSQIR